MRSWLVYLCTFLAILDPAACYTLHLKSLMIDFMGFSRVAKCYGKKLRS